MGVKLVQSASLPIAQLLRARSLNQDYEVVLIESDILVDHKTKIQRFTIDATNCIWYVSGQDCLLVAEVDPAAPSAIIIHKLDFSSEALSTFQIPNTDASVKQLIARESPGATRQPIELIDVNVRAVMTSAKVAYYSLSVSVIVVVALVVTLYVRRRLCNRIEL